MVTKIEYLKCFGIFNDFTSPSTLTSFERFNLFYGWNGCGKSTLSKLFASIEKKKIDEDFKGCEFKIVTDRETITEENISDSTTTIKVFNQDFIKANIEWDKKVNSLLLIAEDKIEDRNCLAELKKEIFQLTNKADKLLQDQQHCTNQTNAFYSSSASTIKESFKIIDTQDKYYFNYNKTKFESFINANPSAIENEKSILAETEREKLVKSIQPVEKTEISFQLAALQKHSYEDALARIKGILSKDVVAKTIDRLKENPNINNWVQQGLALHEELKSDTCEFCNQPLPERRLSDLTNHFSQAYVQLMEQIKNAIQWIDTKVNTVFDFPDTVIFYDEFQPAYKEARAAVEQSKSGLNDVMNVWKSVLEQKQNNPFQNYELAENDLSDIIDGFNKGVAAIEALIERHNKKTKNFAADIKQKKAKLELHYAASLIKKSKLAQWQKEHQDAEKQIGQIRVALTSKNKQAQMLEASLIDEAKGADQFNKYLHKFLGRTDISLRFNKEAKGYNILRGKEGKVARNLSEGEKTAIAFVYFVIKLQERGNKIEETIIVVDDPISSFDSNHLFHSYSFLKSTCEGAKQLFVLTHNFQYFRLIRDWFDKKNKTEWKDGKKVEKIKSRFFAIEASFGEDRSSSIKNAHDTLQKYNSEYHYVFNKMVLLKDNEIDDLDKAYLIGNLCRKLLEGFLTFKFPKARNDFRALMNDCTEDKELLERIYRFINKYSHNQLIEFHDTPVDNLISEGNTIITDVFDLVKQLDAKHFEEMTDICKN